jgi:hypothetical protein
MKKLSLIALAILTSLSIFAKVNKEVKPEKKNIIYQTFNEYLNKKNSSLKSVESYKEKVVKTTYNTTYFFVITTILGESSEIFYCEGYLLNYFTEVTQYLQHRLIAIEVDDDGNIVLELTLANWFTTEIYKLGDCPDLGGEI